jgi:hypothetical protein
VLAPGVSAAISSYKKGWALATNKRLPADEVEQSKRLGKQPDEAMPRQPGDARAGKRARTGGAKKPRTRSTELRNSKLRLTGIF